MTVWALLSHIAYAALAIFGIVALGAFVDACSDFRKLVNALEKFPQVQRAAIRANVKPPQGQAVPRAIPAFQLRPRFVQRRATWEAKHNTKAQMNASIAEQIRRAQEGTLT